MIVIAWLLLIYGIVQALVGAFNVFLAWGNSTEVSIWLFFAVSPAIVLVLFMIRFISIN